MTSDTTLDAAEQELVEAATALIPALTARGQEIDELRQLPQELADEMAALGFYRLIVPEPLGGLAISPLAFVRVCEELAKGNGSAAWCVFIGSTSQYLFAAAERELLDEMLSDPNVITSGVFADTGTVRAEERDGEAGFVVNGHWRWGSGCRNAAWISGGVHEIDERGEPVTSRERPITRAFFLPEEIHIQDNWHVSGLRGSGSSDYTAENLWLPARRMATTVDGTEYEADPIYQFSRFGILGIPIGAICLGMARAALDEVLTVALEKTPMNSRRTLAQRPSIHLDVATADTELRAARAWFLQTIQDAWSHATIGPSTLDQRRVMRAANVHAVTTAVKVIDRMYTIVGGTSVYETSSLQRNFRDVHVATQHMMVGESVMEVCGRIMLGLDPEGFGI